MSKRELIYPWTAGKLDASKVLKSEIMQEIKARYPTAANMREPDAKVVRAVSSIVNELLDLVDEGKVPWMVCASGSVMLLQTLARVVPVTLMLTRLMKPLNVDTDMMVGLFRQPTPLDDFADDPAGEMIHSIKNRGVVVWENFGELKLGGFKYASQFMSVLGYRLERRKVTIFMCAYSGGFTDSVFKEILDRLEKSVGANVPVMLREAAVWKHLKAAPEKFKFHSTEEV